MPIKKYIESAEIETEIIQKILKADKEKKSYCVNIIDAFRFFKDETEYYAIIFELLSLSLYDFIKQNSYKGFTMNQIQQIAKQIFEGVAFLHSINIVHTDLKPENIILENADYDVISDYDNLPVNTILKEENESGNNSVNSMKSLSNGIKQKEVVLYKKLKNTNIKIIDFGSAVEIKETGKGIINTRQYRAPEVILNCYDWDAKSDIWSIACILMELYTGELLFPTHNNQEHLCLIEKVCGHYPSKMVRNTEDSELYELFIDCPKHQHDKKIDIKRCVKYNEVKNALAFQRKLNECINPRHHMFEEFMKFLLKIDPRERPSAEEALKHDFFSKIFLD